MPGGLWILGRGHEVTAIVRDPARHNDLARDGVILAHHPRPPLRRTRRTALVYARDADRYVATATMPSYAEYQRSTSRIIAVVALDVEIRHTRR